jgi:hypothetical protein
VDRAWQLHADPDVVDRLDTAELARLLVHLTAHLVRDHAARAAARRGEWTTASGGTGAPTPRSTTTAVADGLATGAGGRDPIGDRRGGG